MIARIRMLLVAVLAALAILQPAAARSPRRAVTILVSIDGFRADYLERGLTPNLAALAAGGARGTMRPSFPSVTYPNHWTLVTGLRPDRHGVVNGIMRDAAHPGAVFGKDSAEPFWWDGGEPVWGAAESAGIATGTVFWPGSYGAVRGVRPRNWVPFSKDITPAQEADFVLDWMRRPAATRPRFVAVYLGDVDIAGHRHGPDSPEVAEALRKVDAAIGQLRRGLRALGQPANLVIVSDHGMAAIDQSRVIQLASVVDPANVQPVSGGPFVAFNAAPGRETALAEDVKKLPPWVHCWPRGAMPARFHYGTHPRTADWNCLADMGGRVLVAPVTRVDQGDHGYDPEAPEMRALFIGNGPAFRRGRTVPTFDNVAIEPLLRDLIGLAPGKDRDGDDAPLRGVLSRR